eukprot:scaffold90468_cov20-Tisochrysis_lutea.AAC.1
MLLCVAPFEHVPNIELVSPWRLAAPADLGLPDCCGKGAGRTCQCRPTHWGVPPWRRAQALAT